MARLRPGRSPLATGGHSLGFFSSIGSDRSNTIILSGGDIQPRHADIENRGGKFFIVCASPKASVAINGAKIKSEQELKNGDVLLLGMHEYTFDNANSSATQKFATQRMAVVGAVTQASSEIDPKTRLAAFNDVLDVLDSFKKSEKLQVHISTMYKVASLVSESLSPSTLREKLFDILFETLAPDRVFVVVHDESGRQKVFAQRVRAEIQQQGLVQIGQTIVKHVTASKEAVLMENFTETMKVQSAIPGAAKNGSCVCAPMTRQDKVRGVLYADRLQVNEDFRAFREEDLKLINAIAAQFSIAYENALMYEKSVEFGKKLSLLNEAARHLSTSLDVERVVQGAVECAARILECEKCSVLMWDEAQKALTVAYSNWLPKTEWDKVKIESGQGYAGRVYMENSAMLVIDTRSMTAEKKKVYRSDSFVIVPITMSAKPDEKPVPIGVIAVTDRRDNRPFDESDQKILGILGLQIGASLRQAKVELGRKLNQHELGIAAKIQNGLLPKVRPQLPGFQIASFYQPKEAVGGDYYDFIPIDENRMGMVIADVSGKGVPASMIMTEMRTCLHVMAYAAKSPRELMSAVNRRLHQDLPRGMFITSIYGVLDRRDSSFTFVSCGHNPMFLWRAATGQVESINVAGMALGPDAGARFEQASQEARVELGVGDRFVMYTDGLTEAMNPREEMFEDKCLEVIGELHEFSSDEFIPLLVQALIRFREGREQPDDLTILSVRRGE